MPRAPSLKPYRSTTSPHRPFCVDVPPLLSDTGKRQRLFFPTQQEAKAVCEKLKSRRDNFGVSLTVMSPARIAKAAECYKLLDPLEVDLLDAVRSYIEAHKQRAASIGFLKLCNQYIDSRQGRHPGHLQGLRNCRDRFPSLHARLVSDLSHRDLEPLLSPISPGGRNLLMRHLRAFFNFGIKRGYLVENPISRLDFVEVKRTEVETIPVKGVEALLNDALVNDLELLPFLTLGFFCGIRPDGELQKLDWSDVDLADKVITIKPEIAKTNRRRFVEVSPNAIEWLNAYRSNGGLASGPIIACHEGVLYERRRQNRKRAGVARWPNSAMRHTFCSNWLAQHGDVNRLVLLAGHTNVDTMWRHYHRGTRKEDADAFWNITPPAQAENIVPMAQAS